MCEHCIRYEEDDEELPEITQEDIDFWRENGKYYGYPKCCIDAFCNREGFELTPAQEQVIDNHGFIPCQKHALMIIKGKATLEGLIKKRKCKYKYPMDDQDAELIKAMIHYDPEF